MARRKMWFLSRLWLVMDRKAALLMLTEIGLSNDQIRAVIKRFWDGLPVKSIGEISPSEQRKNLPVWDNWAQNWCRQHKGDFSRTDREMLFGIEKEMKAG